ncbi:hypothetical protein ABPG72_006591 [Tetrahymena utriculariae]
MDLNQEEYYVNDDISEEMDSAAYIIEKLEKKFINPLKYFEQCSYEEILQIKSNWQNKNQKSPEVDQKFRNYQIFNEDIDIFLNIDIQRDYNNKLPEDNKSQKPENYSEESQDKEDQAYNDDLNDENQNSSSDSKSCSEEEIGEVDLVNKEKFNENQEDPQQVEQQICFSVVQHNIEEQQEEVEQEEKDNIKNQQVSVGGLQQNATLEEISKEEYMDKTNLDQTIDFEKLNQDQIKLMNETEQNVDLNEETLRKLKYFDHIDIQRDYNNKLPEDNKSQKPENYSEESQNKEDQPFNDDLNDENQNSISDSKPCSEEEIGEVDLVNKEKFNENQEDPQQVEQQICFSVVQHNIEEQQEEVEQEEKDNIKNQQVSVGGLQQNATLEEINKEEYMDKTNLDLIIDFENFKQDQRKLMNETEQYVDLNEETLLKLKYFDQIGHIQSHLNQVFVAIAHWNLKNIMIQQLPKNTSSQNQGFYENYQNDIELFNDLDVFYKNHIYCDEFYIQQNLKDIFEKILNEYLDIFLKDQQDIEKHEKRYGNCIPIELYTKKQKLIFFKKFFYQQLDSLIEKFQKNESSQSDKVFCIFLFMKSIEFEIQLYQKQLPSYSAKYSIQEQIYDKQDCKVQLLMGETGSGKSTQVPQMLYALNNFYLKSRYLTNKTSQNSQNVILCVQPRRLACFLLYKRVQIEMHEYNHQVGYYIGNLSTQQRFKNAQIVFITEQVFINQFVKYQKGLKSILTQCSHVIIDEVHERNLKTDIIIGLIHRYLTDPRFNNSGINFLLSSATINKESFEKYFSKNNLKIIEIKGRQYPVKVEYLDSTNQNKSMKNKILDQLEKIIDLNNQELFIETEFLGHILIFLQDQIEINSIINEANNLLKSKKSQKKNYQIMQLHGKLNQSDIQKVFEEKEGVTKIILSTNIAEASITIEGVSVILDSGLEKTMIFDPIRNSNVLTIQEISRSQAEQRKGRAGRTRQGICYRLYTEKQYQEFQIDKQPEIMRINLGFAILKIIYIGVQNINEFEFLSRPSNNLIQNSLDTLEALGAIEIHQSLWYLTDIGKCIIETDLEPTIARIFIKAKYLGVLEEVVKAMAVYTEYNNIFPNSKTSRDLSQAILKDYEQSLKQEEQNQNLINQYNSDFVFMWITFDYLNEKYKQKKYYEIQNIKIAFKKLDEYCKEAMQQMNDLFEYLKSKKLTYLRKEQSNSEIQQIIKSFQISQQDKQTTQQKYEKIVQAFFTGFSNQLAVYTGIHKLGFLNIKTNVLFYVHPSSSLNSQNYSNQANRQFQKGQILFFSLLEEREVNNFAKFVSFLKPDWIKDQSILQRLQDKSNFEPYLKLNGERPLLDFFSRNQFLNIQKQLIKMDLPKKAKYCVLFEKDLGYIRFFCNSEMEPYFLQLNIDKIFQEAKDQYQKEQQNEQIIVRYKDSFNYALLRNGLTIKELILPHQFLRVSLTDIPFKSNQQSIQNLVQQIGDNKQRKFNELKIIKDYINQTATAIFFFKNTKRAYAFYENLTKMSRSAIAKSLQAEDNQLPKIVPQSECNYYIEQIKNLSSIVIRAQWSISESLCYGFMYFSNEIDALSTYDQLKKAKLYKVKYSLKEDAANGNIIHILSLERLDPLTDEIELESYVINTYQGFLSCEVKRQQMDVSIQHNLGLEEASQKRNLINQIGDTINQFSYLNTKQANKSQKLQKGQQKQQDAKENIKIKLRIHNSICKAEIMLDSLVQAKELTNKFDGIQFGQQKLRMQIQNQQKILVLGSVYLFYYDNIWQYIQEAGQAIQVIAPKKNQVYFLSKLVDIITKQVYSNSALIFQKLNFQITNLIKPDLIYFDCLPLDLENLMNKQHSIVQEMEKQYQCIIKLSVKRSSQLKVWFRKERTDEYITQSKAKIKKGLEEHLFQKFKFKKQNYHLKSVEEYFQNLQIKKIIEKYESDNKNFIIMAKKSQIQTIQKLINDPSKNYLKQKSKAEQDGFEEEETCQICQEIKNLQRFSCGCLFCKECIQIFFLTQTQQFQSSKPLACPSHQEEPVSIKLIESIFDPQQLSELIQLRIDHSIESMIHPIYKKQTYIRCPSVNCNQFFERIYDQAQEIEDLSSEGIISSNQETFEEIQEQLIDTDNFGKAPSRVKCYGCFQEYCLICSGIYFETPEKQIHNTHSESTCYEYFKQLQLDKENLKGIEFITCPKCNFKATKGEGCNHITCKCGAHFCAKCLKEFKTPKEVYQHLDEEHQGYYN